MYRKYFGLTSYPFKNTPDLNMFYKHGSRQEILEALLYTITRGDGIVKVTGDVGSGKSMLLRLLSNRLSSDFEIVYIDSPNLSSKDLLLYICYELGINHPQDVQKFTLTNLLKNKLLELHGANRKVVMLIDEAQSMTYDTLEELRLLSNIETDQDKLLQMVLFGQPELDTALNAEKIRQFKSRINYSMFLPPLQGSDVQAYLNYRMRKAGYSGLDVFDLKISKQIQNITQGLPRHINVVADKVLMSIFSSVDKFAKSKHLKNLPELGVGVRVKSPARFFYYLAVITMISLFLSFSMFSNFFKTFSSNTHAISDMVGNRAPNIMGGLSKDSAQKLLDYPLTPNELASSEKSELDDSQVVKEQSKVTVIDSTSQLKRGKENPSIMIQLDNVDTLNQINNHFKSLGAIVDNPQQLKKIIDYHSKGKAWLELLSEKFVIQLSTDNIKAIDEIIRFHQSNKLSSDVIHIVIDYSNESNKYRLKVFYLASSDFLDLSREIDSLPPKYNISSPYIVMVEQVVQNLHYTETKLQAIGILNE